LKIFIKNTEKSLIDSFIRQFIELTKKKKRIKKRFSFVLTGGQSPINLYKKLSKAKIDWSNIDFFWGDERFVSKKSINSNFNLAEKHLLKKIKIKKKQLFPIDTNKKNYFRSSLDYKKKITKYFNYKKINFDLILLGMGEDGHIASIFPNISDKNKNKNKNIISVARSDFNRISLSLETINNSKDIFLWLNSRRITKIFKLLKKNNQKIPVYNLKKNKISVFQIL
jgi:6-phosphogluconolactonase